MVAWFANPDIGGKQAGRGDHKPGWITPILVVKVRRQGDHKPGWTSPILVVNRQGDHKGRPYSGLFSAP